jgi:hypothetical protein
MQCEVIIFIYFDIFGETTKTIGESVFPLVVFDHPLRCKILFQLSIDLIYMKDIR